MPVSPGGSVNSCLPLSAAQAWHAACACRRWWRRGRLWAESVPVQGKGEARFWAAGAAAERRLGEALGGGVPSAGLVGGGAGCSDPSPAGQWQAQREQMSPRLQQQKGSGITRGGSPGASGSPPSTKHVSLVTCRPNGRVTPSSGAPRPGGLLVLHCAAREPWHASPALKAEGHGGGRAGQARQRQVRGQSPNRHPAVPGKPRTAFTQRAGEAAAEVGPGREPGCGSSPNAGLRSERWAAPLPSQRAWAV